MKPSELRACSREDILEMMAHDVAISKMNAVEQQEQEDEMRKQMKQLENTNG